MFENFRFVFHQLPGSHQAPICRHFVVASNHPCISAHDYESQLRTCFQNARCLLLLPLPSQTRQITVFFFHYWDGIWHGHFFGLACLVQQLAALGRWIAVFRCVCGCLAVDCQECVPPYRSFHQIPSRGSAHTARFLFFTSLFILICYILYCNVNQSIRPALRSLQQRSECLFPRKSSSEKK